MKVIGITLKGRTAFFKKPDVNTYCYFTYGHIHKVALLGLFGAVLGYGGYGQMKSVKSPHKGKLADEYPEFYERLKDLSVSICPKNEKGLIPKRIQVFNNSIGYASQELGGNLIVKEQWLENPNWEIYILLNNDEAWKLSEAFQEKRCVFTPYLGKNDHYADIEVKGVYDTQVLPLEECVIMDSLFLSETMEMTNLKSSRRNRKPTFKYQEKLPHGMDPLLNKYELRSFTFTNHPVLNKSETVYKVIIDDNEKHIGFY